MTSENLPFYSNGLKLLQTVENPAVQTRVRQDAIRRLPKTGLRCACTTLLYLREAGLITAAQVKSIYYNAEALANFIKGGGLHDDNGKRVGYTTFSEPFKVRAGDIIMCIDANDQKGSDHIWIAVGDAYLKGKNWYVMCCDNQKNWRPHIRNLSDIRVAGVRVGKLPMRGAIRLK